MVSGPVFEDNMKPWSGDHCIDPRLVPGVFFCNRKVDTAEPALVDIAPTALRLFGIEPPAAHGRPPAGGTGMTRTRARGRPSPPRHGYRPR